MRVRCRCDLKGKMIPGVKIQFLLAKNPIALPEPNGPSARVPAAPLSLSLSQVENFVASHSVRWQEKSSGMNYARF